MAMIDSRPAALQGAESLESLTVSDDVLEFADLAGDVLSRIISLLGVEQLAAMAVQSTRLRTLAEEQPAWQQACKDRWQAFLVDSEMKALPDTPSVWREAFRTRIELPVTLARACDTARRAQLCARADNPGLSHACPAGRPIDFRRAFELTMRAVFEVGLAAESDLGVHKNSLVRGFEESLQWWLVTRPEVLIAFVREADSDLGQYDMWRMAFIHWPSVPWKRSALAYLPGLIAKVSQAWEHVSVLEALDREVALLDNTIRSLENQGDSLTMIAPEGISKRHWWWWLS